MQINYNDYSLSDTPKDDDPNIISVNIEDLEIPNEKEISKNLLILPLRNNTLFPKVVSPILMGRNYSLNLIKAAYESSKYIGVVAQRDKGIESPKIKDLYEYGTIARIIKIIELPDKSKSVIIQGVKRFKITKHISEEPFIRVQVETIDDYFPYEKEYKEFHTIIESLREISIEILEISVSVPDEAITALKNIDDPEFLVNFVCSNIEFEVEKKQELIKIDSIKMRALMLFEDLLYELKRIHLEDDIYYKVQKELNKKQKKYILEEQLKTIKEELGDEGSDYDIKDLKKKAKTKKWSKKVAQTFQKELKKLEQQHSSSPDYSIQLTYLQTLLELPWNKFTKDNFDLPKAEKILDQDHFGLDKVKERILEYLSVLKLKGNLKSPILCLYGPPGVGKTSLGKSIARALKRKYIRMSLGGLHDESEIRGHRKTYIGAMPGRIIQNIKRAKSSNPVFVLDEIDKIGSDHRGDPSDALLEVLDPEQNSTFYDNYLELEFDLSNVMFVATANTLNTIKPALLDRMELINVTGYIIEEKIEIAKQHLIAKQLKNHGIKKNQAKFSDEVLEFIVQKYTRESGVRELDKTIASVIRKIAKKIAFNQKRNAKLSKQDIIEMLGSPKFLDKKYSGNKIAGIVTGLSWTSVGGVITTIESSISRGAGKLTLTGNLGNVMKESAIIALEYIKSYCTNLKIHPKIFNHWNIHIHVPEGAIPKDGPSAGITMATSIASLLTQRRIKPKIAMTGEMTLTGKVLPVGGVKEKILAAKRAGINEIILSVENKNDIEEIKEIYRRGVKFHYVEYLPEVFNIAILNEKVDNPIKIGVPKKKK